MVLTKNMAGNPCLNLIELAHFSVRRAVLPGASVLDATAGNGNDTLRLAELVGADGLVLAFETQSDARQNTSDLLAKHNMRDRVLLHCCGHEEMGAVLGSDTRLSVAMFNLGFLPGGNRNYITRPATTISALNAVKAFIVPGGLISIHCYSGHDGGREESERVLSWAKEQPRKSWWIYRYETYNKQQGVENLLLMEKL